MPDVIAEAQKTEQPAATSTEPQKVEMFTKKEAAPAPAPAQATETKQAAPEEKSKRVSLLDDAPAKQEAAAPAEYKLKLPKDSLMDQSDIDRIASYAKDRNLSNEDAQHLIDGEQAAVDAYLDRQTNANIEAAVKDRALSKDGRTIDPQVKQTIKQAFNPRLDRGGAAYKKIVASPLSSDPDVLNWLLKLGKGMEPDKVGGREMPASNAPPKSTEQVLFGSVGTQ